MANLKEIAAAIRENRLTLEEAVLKYNLDSRQISRIRQYAGCPIKKIKTKAEIEDALDEYIGAYIQLLKQKPPRPKKRVCIKGKWYTDVTADLIDCGG